MKDNIASLRERARLANEELAAAEAAVAAPVKPLEEYTREDLIAICEHAVVPVDSWWDRDSAGAQEKVGMAWVLLRAGCDWKIAADMYKDRPDEAARTIWIRINYPGFAAKDWDGANEEELIYLPTTARLEERAGGDWY